MDILEMILRGLYFAVLYAIILNLFKYSTPLSGNPLIATSVFISALVLYVSFDVAKNFLSENEIVFKVKKVNEDNETENTESESNNASQGNSQIYNEQRISDDNRSISNITEVNHRHNYLTNGTLN